MTMQRWDPFNPMPSLRQVMDRLLEDAFIWPGQTLSAAGAQGFGIPVDVLERENELVVKASLPGLRPEDVNLSVHGNTLTIDGEVREERDERPTQGNGQQAKQGEPRYHYRERRHGRYFRQIVLPVPVDANQTDARFENGVLTVTMPKAPEARQRRIAVSAGGQAQQLPAGQTGQSASASRR